MNSPQHADIVLVSDLGPIGMMSLKSPEALRLSRAAEVNRFFGLRLPRTWGCWRRGGEDPAATRQQLHQGGMSWIVVSFRSFQRSACLP
jgi:hypothetical protein